MADANAITPDFMAKMEGRTLRLKGKISDIKAEGSAMPRFRVDYSGTEVWDILDDE